MFPGCMLTGPPGADATDVGSCALPQAGEAASSSCDSVLNVHRAALYGGKFLQEGAREALPGHSAATLPLCVAPQITMRRRWRDKSVD
jgi:hypothetical protein